MKFSLFKNDKTTYKDELILALMIIVSGVCGGLLITFRPYIGFISWSETTVFGVLLAMFAIMFIPGLIYRLMTNE